MNSVSCENRGHILVGAHDAYIGLVQEYGNMATETI